MIISALKLPIYSNDSIVLMSDTSNRTEHPASRLDEAADYYFAGAMIFVLAMFGVYLFILLKQKRLSLKALVKNVKLDESGTTTVCERKRLSRDSVLYVVETGAERVLLVESSKSITVLSNTHVGNNVEDNFPVAGN